MNRKEGKRPHYPPLPSLPSSLPLLPSVTMKRIVKLPVFYLCLVCGGVLVLYLHSGQDTLTDILQIEGSHKLPSIQIDIKHRTYKPDPDTPADEASKPAHNTPGFLTSPESPYPTPDTSVTRRTPVHSTPEKLPEEKDEDDEEGEEEDEVTAPSPLPSPPPPPLARKEEEEEEEEKKKKGLKTILVWNNGYGQKRMGFDEGQESFLLHKCEVNTCYITADRSYLPVNSFDAVIFHLRPTDPQDLPKMRSPKQRWIMYEVESASYLYQDLAYYDGVFNWTMTYRLDSDIPFRYGRIDPIKPPFSSLSPRNYAEGKTKLAAWFVSNCLTHSRREKIVQFMKDVDMEVDVYGKCGKLKCPRESQECYGLLDKHYKFYLSFENSLCKDYVTEKLFNILRHDVVPVVFGLANYTAIAPPHSFINVLDFSSVRGLVDYLKYLDKNDDAYNRYFKWKERYRVLDGWDATRENFCALCKKLHQDSKPKVYWNMKSWFVKRGKCKRAHGMPLHSLRVSDPLMEKYEILIKDKSFEEFLMV